MDYSAIFLPGVHTSGSGTGYMLGIYRQLLTSVHAGRLLKARAAPPSEQLACIADLLELLARRGAGRRQPVAGSRGGPATNAATLNVIRRPRAASPAIGRYAGMIRRLRTIGANGIGPGAAAR